MAKLPQSFTLADIEEKTALHAERLRYVVDSEILPGARNRHLFARSNYGRGVARRYLPLEAFGIVLAHLLLDGGLKKNHVAGFFDLLCEYRPGTGRSIENTLLYQAYTRAEIVSLEIGDGVNVRFTARSLQAADTMVGSWVQVETHARLVDYAPLVSVVINLEKLRRFFAP
jgi:hypothetical protein